MLFVLIKLILRHALKCWNTLQLCLLLTTLDLKVLIPSIFGAVFHLVIEQLNMFVEFIYDFNSLWRQLLAKNILKSLGILLKLMFWHIKIPIYDFQEDLL